MMMPREGDAYHKSVVYHRAWLDDFPRLLLVAAK